MKKGTKCFGKIICLCSIIIMILSTSFLSFATTEEELNNQKKENEKKINQTDKELENVKNEMNSTINQINKLREQISSYETEIDNLEKELDDLEKQIAESEEKIKQAEEDYKKQKELLDRHLVTMYQSGETSYLDVLLNTTDLTDFLSSYYLVTELTKYDTQLMEKIEKQRQEIENAKKVQEENKRKVESIKKNKEDTANALKESRQQKSNYVNKLSEDEKTLQKQLDELEADNKRIDQKIKSLQISYTGKPSLSGFIRPMRGYSITTGWYYSDGRLHGASDFSGSGIYGQPILAAKSGTVMIVEHLKTSYGNYVMINHHDGTYTLYAHMSQTAAYTGQSVSQGQVIGYVGSSGNSTGPHLHFEIRTGSGTYSERVNPINYLP